MLSLAIQLLSIFASSLLTALLIFLKIPTVVYQQLIASLVILIIILSNRFLNPKYSSFEYRILKNILLFLSSFLILLIVISSGDLYSPFIILIHIFVIFTSFLLNSIVAFTFLGLFLLISAFDIYWNPIISNLFRQDPGSAALYLISFVVIMPVAQLMTSQYRLKDRLFAILSSKVKLSESILANLNELVVVVDKDLAIISANKALEEATQLSNHQIIGKNLFSILDIRDLQGNLATREAFLIDYVLTDKGTRIFNDFLLYPKNKSFPIPINITVKSFIEPTDKNILISIIIREGHSMSKNNLSKISDLVQSKFTSLINQLRKDIHSPNIAKAEVELALKIEEELVLMKEIEYKPFKINLGLVDIANLCQEVVSQKQKLAQSLGVKLTFTLPPDEISELSLLNLRQSQLPQEIVNSAVSSFSEVTDSYWFKQMILRLIDISILLSLSTPNHATDLMAYRVTNRIVILIKSSYQISQGFDQAEIFKEGYGKLANSNLKLGSGIEGVIASIIAKYLNTQIELSKEDNFLVFKLQLTRQAKKG